MSGPELSGKDPIGVAWDAFVREDRALLAPSRLKSRVHQAAQRHLAAPVSGGRRRIGFEWRRHLATMAAGLCLVCAGAGLGHWLASSSRTGGTPARSLALANGGSPRAAASAAAENRPAARSGSETPRQQTARRRARSADPPVAAFAGRYEAWDTFEPSRLVRVRVPPSSLAAFGVRLDGSALLVEEGALVDVDLVVGVDGWPRDVLRIRAVEHEVFQAQVEER